MLAGQLPCFLLTESNMQHPQKKAAGFCLPFLARHFVLGGGALWHKKSHDWDCLVFVFRAAGGHVCSLWFQDTFTVTAACQQGVIRLRTCRCETVWTNQIQVKIKLTERQWQTASLLLSSSHHTLWISPAFLCCLLLFVTTLIILSRFHEASLQETVLLIKLSRVIFLSESCWSNKDQCSSVCRMNCRGFNFLWYSTLWQCCTDDYWCFHETLTQLDCWYTIILNLDIMTKR